MTTKTTQHHTPGPWHINAGIRNKLYVESGQAFVCDLQLDEAENGDGQVLADAHLIAAAPELLEALKAIDARIKGRFDDLTLVKRGPLAVHMLDDIHNWAKTAITKAEGKD